MRPVWIVTIANIAAWNVKMKRTAQVATKTILEFCWDLIVCVIKATLIMKKSFVLHVLQIV